MSWSSITISFFRYRIPSKMEEFRVIALFVFFDLVATIDPLILIIVWGSVLNDGVNLFSFFSLTNIEILKCDILTLLCLSAHLFCLAFERASLSCQLDLLRLSAIHIRHVCCTDVWCSSVVTKVLISCFQSTFSIFNDARLYIIILLKCSVLEFSCGHNGVVLVCFMP